MKRGRLLAKMATRLFNTFGQTLVHLVVGKGGGRGKNTVQTHSCVAPSVTGRQICNVEQRRFCTCVYLVAKAYKTIKPK